MWLVAWISRSNPASLRFGLDPAQERGKERAANLGQQQSQCFGAAAGQNARGGARDKCQFLDRILDPSGCLAGYRSGLVDHPADRGDRNARLLGNI